MSYLKGNDGGLKSIIGERLNVRDIFSRAFELRGFWAFAIVFLLGVIFDPGYRISGRHVFLTLQTQRDILFEYSEYGILAAGMTLVILAAGIDLSVGSVLGFIATFFALLMIGYGWDPLPAVLLSLLLGAGAGAVNGFITARFRLQPFVATLAMMVGARGLAKLISGGIKIAPGAAEWYKVQSDTPPFFTWLTTSLKHIGLQPLTIIFLLVIIVLFIVVRYTRFGRNLYAVGGNEEAARLSGVSVFWTKTAAYSICGTMAALAGISNAARLEIGDPESGATYELDAIAAVVIGGTSLMGGRGGMFFTLVGTLIIAYINKILSINNVEESYRLLAKGIIIVLAVLIQQRKRGN